MAARLGMMAGMVLTALLLDTAVAPIFAVGGWRPDVLTVTVVGFAMVDGPATGARYGFVAGLAADLLAGPSQIFGLSALVLLSLGHLTGVLRPYVGGTPVGAQVLLGAGGASLSVLAYGLLGTLLDTGPGQALVIVEAALWVGLYSGAVAPLIIGPVRALSLRMPRTTAFVSRA